MILQDTRNININILFLMKQNNSYLGARNIFGIIQMSEIEVYLKITYKMIKQPTGQFLAAKPDIQLVNHYFSAAKLLKIKLL